MLINIDNDKNTTWEGYYIMTDSNDNDSKDLQIINILNGKTVNFIDENEKPTSISGLDMYALQKIYNASINKYNYRYKLITETNTDIVIKANNININTKKYSEAIKHTAVAMHQSGCSLNSIAKQLGIGSHVTVKKWVEDDRLNPLNPIANNIKKRFKNKLIMNSNQLFDSAMDKDKIDSASLLQLTTAGKIMLDSQALITEDQQQTILEQYSQSETLENNLDASSDEILELEAMIKEMESKPDNSSNELDLPF